MFATGSTRSGASARNSPGEWWPATSESKQAPSAFGMTPKSRLPRREADFDSAAEGARNLHECLEGYVLSRTVLEARNVRCAHAGSRGQFVPGSSPSSDASVAICIPTRSDSSSSSNQGSQVRIY
jgi:hypothetical protein